MIDLTKIRTEIMFFIDTVHELYGKNECEKNVLIVTHNHIIDAIHKIFIEKSENSQMENYKKYKVNNCSLSCIKFIDR